MSHCEYQNQVGKVFDETKKSLKSDSLVGYIFNDICQLYPLSLLALGEEVARFQVTYLPPVPQGQLSSPPHFNLCYACQAHRILAIIFAGQGYIKVSVFSIKHACERLRFSPAFMCVVCLEPNDVIALMLCSQIFRTPSSRPAPRRFTVFLHSYFCWVTDVAHLIGSLIC